MALKHEIEITTTKRQAVNKQFQMGLQRKMSALLLLAVSSGAFIATPQLARAEFTPNPAAPNYIASGSETTPQSLAEDNLQVVTEEGFSIETDSGTALTLSGAGAISYNDNNESRLVSGAGAYGLSVTSTGDAGDIPGSVTVHTNGTIQGGWGSIYTSNNGSGDTEITVENSTGSIAAENEVNARDVIVNVEGEVNGNILVNNRGTGQIRMTAEGSVTADSGTAIVVLGEYRNTGLTVTAASVNSGGNGLFISSAGEGDTVIDIEGAVNASSGNGMYIGHSHNAENLRVSAGSVMGGNNGIRVSSSGEGNVDIAIEGSVTGITGYGIEVRKISVGNLNVNAGSVSGGKSGIFVENGGYDSIDITVVGLASGDTEYGIDALNEEGTQSLTVSAGSARGGLSGVRAQNNGTGNTSITVTGNATGTSDYGIQATNGEAAQDLTVRAGSANGGKSGITATNNGTGSTLITATDALVGESGSGVEVLNGESAQNLTVNVASASGGVSGIVAQNEGSGNTEITANGIVRGDTSYGVVAFNTANAQDLSVNVADVWSGAYGIFIGNSGTGDTTITATGLVTGDTADGISAVNGETAGNLRVNVADVSGAHTGILTYNAGSGITSITIGGVVEGTAAAIDADSSSSQAIEITNNGTMRNSSQSAAGLAISSGSGAVVINNNQSLLGVVTLGDQGNTFNNAGTWQVAGATSELGGGANLLDNKAGGSILAANAQGAVTTTFTGASTVLHSGSLVLQNREAGGDIAYAGDIALFTNGGSGDFQSNGGSLHLDTNFESGVSDRLIVDNVSLVSGPTRVYVNPVGGVTPLTAEGINVVEVTGDSADNAFVLGNSVGHGLYSYQLGRGLSEETGQNWYLRESDEMRGEVPMASALTVLAGRTSLATLSTPHDRQRQGDDAVDYYTRRTGTRLVSRNFTLPADEQVARKGVWGRVFGQSSEFSSNGGTGGGYDASLWGAQAGIDLVASGSLGTGRSYGGVYLGYATARGDALRGNNRLGNLKVNATSIGAYYTRYHSNGFYWDATAQYSRLSDAELKYLGDTTKSDGSSYLVSLEAGKQLNRESKYVAELQGQLLYQKTRIDEMRLADSTRFDVGNLSGVTGRVGVRLARNPHQGARVQPWVSANLWKTFNQDVRVSSLGESATTPAGGTTGEVQLGFSLVPQSSNGWSAYVAGGYQFDVSGSEYSGWKGTLGVRKGW